MSVPHGTTLLTADPTVTERLAEAFGGDELLTPITVCENIRELEHRLDEQPSGLVIVDIEPEPKALLGFVRQLVEALPQSRFVVVAPSFDKQHLFESMQAGARHFMPKDWIGPDMVPICRELGEQVRGGGATKLGSLYTVLSASGGCGATTVALNLAAELGARAGQRALVADLDTRFGGAATHMGVKGEYGIADLLSRNEALDSELVRSTAVRKGDHLDLLLSPASINFAEPAPLYLDELDGTLQALRGGYAATVIDAPGLTLEASAALAELSTATLLVMQLSVKDLRNARLMLAELSAKDLKGPVLVLANRCRGAGKPITLKDAQETLEFGEPIRPLPDDPAGAVRALNSGELLLTACSKSPLRKQIVRLAVDLTEEPGEAAEPKRKKRGRKRAA